MCSDDNTIEIISPPSNTGGGSSQKFKFDKIISPDDNQESVFAEVSRSYDKSHYDNYSLH